MNPEPVKATVTRHDYESTVNTTGVKGRAAQMAALFEQKSKQAEFKPSSAANKFPVNKPVGQQAVPQTQKPAQNVTQQSQQSQVVKQQVPLVSVETDSGFKGVKAMAAAMNQKNPSIQPSSQIQRPPQSDGQPGLSGVKAMAQNFGKANSGKPEDKQQSQLSGLPKKLDLTQFQPSVTSQCFDKFKQNQAPSQPKQTKVEQKPIDEKPNPTTTPTETTPTKIVQESQKIPPPQHQEQQELKLDTLQKEQQQKEQQKIQFPQSESTQHEQSAVQIEKPEAKQKQDEQPTETLNLPQTDQKQLDQSSIQVDTQQIESKQELNKNSDEHPDENQIKQNVQVVSNSIPQDQERKQSNSKKQSKIRLFDDDENDEDIAKVVEAFRHAKSQTEEQLQVQPQQEQTTITKIEQSQPDSTVSITESKKDTWLSKKLSDSQQPTNDVKKKALAFAALFNPAMLGGKRPEKKIVFDLSSMNEGESDCLQLKFEIIIRQVRKRTIVEIDLD